MEFSRQEYSSGLPFPSPGDLTHPGIEPRSPSLQADSSPSEPPGKSHSGRRSCNNAPGRVLPEEGEILSWPRNAKKRLSGLGTDAGMGSTEKEESEAQEERSCQMPAGNACLQTPKCLNLSRPGPWKLVGWEPGTAGSSLPAEVEAEDGAGEGTLLQHALKDGGGPIHGQGGVGHAHDAIKLRIEEIGTRLSLTQAELLVGDLDALDLEGTQRMGSDECNSTHLPLDPPPETHLSVLHPSLTSATSLLDRFVKATFSSKEPPSPAAAPPTPTCFSLRL